MDNKSLKKLEADLWESADLLRAGSKLTSNQYCMPVLGLLFLRYAYSRFKLVEAERLKARPMRRGVPLPIEPADFREKSALFLPSEARYAYLVSLPENIAAAKMTTRSGRELNSLGEVVNNAMELVEEQSEQLRGVLPKDYTMFSDELLSELLRIFNTTRWTRWAAMTRPSTRKSSSRASRMSWTWRNASLRSGNSCWQNWCRRGTSASSNC